MKSSKLLLFAVTFCGTGLLSKRMPGTIGSLAATSLSYMIPKYSILFYIISILLFIIGTITSQQYVNKHSENKDPGFIVIDEACAIFLSNAILLDIFEYSYTVFLFSFIFFRIFDILKPFPINKIDLYFKKLDINNTNIELPNNTNTNNNANISILNSNNNTEKNNTLNTHNNNISQNNINTNCIYNNTENYNTSNLYKEKSNTNNLNCNSEKVYTNMGNNNYKKTNEITSNQENINNSIKNYNNTDIYQEKSNIVNNNKLFYKRFLNGFGIMIDDVVAVIPTVLIIIIISYVIQEYFIFGF